MAQAPRAHRWHVYVYDDDWIYLIVQYQRTHKCAVAIYERGSKDLVIRWDWLADARDNWRALNIWENRTVVGKKFLPTDVAVIFDRVVTTVRRWHREGNLKVGDLEDQHFDVEKEVAKREITAGNVLFNNFTKGDFATHPKATIIRITEQAIAVCKEQWGGWDAGALPLTLVTHPSNKSAMGMAYNPGTGPEVGKRDISLNKRLLRDYDEAAILRVILHELAHHYREEAWPRTGAALPGKRPPYYDAHDARFCHALTLVDPLVAGNKDECTYFTDETWEGGVAARQEAEMQATYAYGKGELQIRALKNRRLKIDWVPDKGRKKVMDFHPNILKPFLANFDPKERPRLAVTATPLLRKRSALWPEDAGTHTTLFKLLEQAQRAYPTAGFEDVL